MLKNYLYEEISSYEKLRVYVALIFQHAIKLNNYLYEELSSYEKLGVYAALLC